jgi:phosphoglycolate phosphatase
VFSTFQPDVMDKPLTVMVNEEFKRDPEVGAVIVGFDEHFSFPKLFKAASYLNDPNVLFLATNTDERLPLPNYVVPGTGSIVRSVEVAAERKPIVMGKPNPHICDAIVQAFKVVPERTLMIGDRCNTDILLGKNCGFQTLLVETGIHKYDPDVKGYMASECEETRRLVPDLVAGKLGDVLPFLE